MGFPECLDTLNQAETDSKSAATHWVCGSSCGCPGWTSFRKREGEAPMGFPECLDTLNQAETDSKSTAIHCPVWT